MDAMLSFRTEANPVQEQFLSLKKKKRQVSEHCSLTKKILFSLIRGQTTTGRRTPSPSYKWLPRQ